MATDPTDTASSADPAKLHLNPSLRLIATFKVLNEATRQFDYIDYLMDRFPIFHQILLKLTNNVSVKDAFANIELELAQELEEKNIVTLLNGEPQATVIGSNPQMIATLTIFARQHGGASKRTAIVLAEQKNALRWLLNAVSGKAESNDLSTLTSDEIQLLSNHHVLVTVNPPAIVHYPNPDNAAPKWLEQTATAEQLFIQRAGEALPEKVQRLLGRQVPELPNADLVWSCDAGTRLPYPTIVPADKLDQLVLGKEQRAKLDSVKNHKRDWKQKIQVAKIGFKRDAFAQIDDIITPSFQSSLQTHMRDLVTNGYFGALDDGQVARRMGFHNETVAASIHHRLAKLVSVIVGKAVQASYAYLGCYLDGSVLERHIDRPQCQYNLSIVYDMSDKQGNRVDPWPIYLQMGKKPLAVNLEPGSGLLYRGTDIEHWRDALPQGQRAIVCFYHFVDPDFSGSLI